MNFYLRLLAIVLFLPLYAVSQSDTLLEERQRENFVYVEAGGNCVLASLNYERMVPFKNRGGGFSFRGGVSWFTEGKGAHFRPLGEINLLLGSKKSFFEMGVGNNNFMTPSFRVGYRLHASSGFLFRAGIIMITKGEWWVPVWPGFSFGYSF